MGWRNVRRFRSPLPGRAPDARRALLLSFVQRYTVLALRVVMLVVLARLLTPRDFGIFAAAAAIIAAGNVVTDMGAKQSLIGGAAPAATFAGGALGLGLATSCVAAVAVNGAALLFVLPSPSGAALRMSLLALSAAFFLQPFASVAAALLMRELRFGVVSLAAIAGGAVQAVTTIYLAWAGFGPVGLAWGTVAELAATALVLCAIVPPPVPSTAHWRALLGSGGRWTLIQAAGRVGDLLVRLTVGAALGFGALGLFTRAQTIVQLFDRALTDGVKPVILPALSDRHRAGREVASIYRRQVVALAAFAWPFFAAVALLLAEPLVRLVLGPRWLAAVPAVRVLAAGGLFLPFVTGVSSYFAALDALGAWLPVALLLQVARLALVFAGARVSLEAACAGLAATIAIEAVAAERSLRRLLGYRGGDFLRALRVSLAPTAAALAGAAGALLALRGHDAGPAARLAAAGGAGGVLWLLVVLGSRHPLRGEIAAAMPSRAYVTVAVGRLLFPFRRGFGRIGEAALLRLLNPRRRWFLPPRLAPAAFFAALAERRVAYVVLRWFDDLPNVLPGHDIDLLVADDDVPRIGDLLTRWPGGQPCDVYSATGLPGFGYRPWFAPPAPTDTIAALPPARAMEVLRRARSNARGIAVPDPADRFFALAYHAIYLKGAWSGLASTAEAAPPAAAGSHDYATTLAALAAPLGLDLPTPVGLEPLDALLAHHGWQPASDTLEKLAQWHPWIARAFFPDGAGRAEAAELAVFFIRERAVAAGLGGHLAALLDARGFDVLETIVLEGDARAAIAAAVRGGNWGRGPWPVSGGPPAEVLIALDTIPVPPAPDARRRHPALDNGRVLAVKEEARNRVNAELPAALRYNPLHATDSSADAWRIVRLLLPGREAALREAVAESMRRVATPEEVLADLTRFGNRAKVEVIRYRDGLAVRKTFRDRAGRCHARELAFYRRFGGELPELLPVLESGSNWFILPFRPNTYGRRIWFAVHPPRLLPLRHVRQLVRFLRHVMAAGYDPIDLTPANNVMLTADGMKLVDFEYAWHAGRPVRPEESCCLGGIPEPFAGETPPFVDYLRAPYATQWYPCIGLDLHSLLHDPAWLQAIKRSLAYPALVFRWAARGVLRRARKAGLPVGREIRHANGRVASAPEAVDRGARPADRARFVGDEPAGAAAAPPSYSSPS